MANTQRADITAIMKKIEEEARRKVAPTVIVNCVVGAQNMVIDADPAVVQAVMMAMIDNAAKYTSKGSVTFGFDDNGDELYFYVKDTGVGVPHNMQEEIFEATDTNADSSLIKATTAVTGLGGEIGVDSRGAGKGSTFWFTVPYTAEAESEPQVAATAADEAASVVNTPEPAPMTSSTGSVILIAEDNESNYALFRSILESRFTLLHAYNGQEAVEMYRANASSISLILMDINMPIMDGYEATRAIREISATVPIVAVTAYAFTTDKQRIFQNGFNAYVSKPISINRLQRVIADLIG